MVVKLVVLRVELMASTKDETRVEPMDVWKAAQTDGRSAA
jgi:hypothetical protein